MKEGIPLIFLLINFFIISLHSREENQVINKKFDWKIYSTKNFDIYYYEDSKPFLEYSAYVLERARIEESLYLNPNFNKRIPFFLFASINDMEQNSITPVGDGIGGLTEPYKDRFMVWSDGSKDWLKDVIYHEFAHEQQFSVLIDGFWKSARILKTYIYPLWMMEGISEYATGDNDIAIEEMYVRDSVISGNPLSLLHLQQFGHLKPHQMTLAYKTGDQAIRFLAEEYGQDKPALMMQIYRNKYDINSVLQQLIGIDIFTFDRKFKEYLDFKYYSQIKNKKLEDVQFYGKKLTYQKDDIPDFNLSPVYSENYKKIIYISTKQGHPPILVIKDIENGKEIKLDYMKMDIENIPYSRFTKIINSLSISKNGRYIIFSAQKNHKEYLCIYDLKNNDFKKILMSNFMEARQFSFSPDDKKIVFVGMVKGINDLYEIDFPDNIYEIKLENARKITDNFQDEISPSYLNENEIIYSCENGYFDDLKRDLCLVSKNGEIRKILSMKGNIYDPVYDNKEDGIYFISDEDNIFNLYFYSINKNKVYKMTNVVGGVFSPSISNEHIYFSYFRNGSMNIYEADRHNFRYEEIPLSLTENLKRDKLIEVENIGKEKEYKFKASTDLFFPAFLFSSPGGLFWMNYWQASDFLGYHNIGFYLNYNSAYTYYNYQFQYSYNKFITKIIYQRDSFSIKDVEDENVGKYNKEYSRNIFGLSYPFDRYKKAEFYFLTKDEYRNYKDLGIKYNNRTRAFQLSYISDYINGLYLLATYGNRIQFTYQKALEEFNGNEKYDLYLFEDLYYIPLSRKSTIVNRFFGAFSNGRDRKNFDYGGINGLRGFMRGGDSNENTRALVYDIELRFPLTNMNYYMWYMFPDFYFKAIYFKIFSDNAYGWDYKSEISNFKISHVKSSIGFGLNFHTFVLQAFQMILSFDYAFRLNDGGKIFYFYLGPLF